MDTKKYMQKKQWVRNGLLIIAILGFSREELHCTTSVSEPTSETKSSYKSETVKLPNAALTASVTKNETQNTQDDKKAEVYSPKGCGGFDAHIDFLYWKANEDGLEYGTKMTANPIIGESSTTKTKLLDMHFNWDPGFRLGAGYVFENYDCWAINLDWTYIHSYANGTSHAKGIESQVGNVDTIISPWVNLLFELRAGASKASAHWHVDYNTLDLVVGRDVSLSKRLSLNPYFGFRGAWIDQKYRVDYKSNFILMESAPTFTRKVTFKGKNEFISFGLRAGGELTWRLCEQLYLYSQFSGNILYGKFNVKMKNLNDQGLGEGSIDPMPLDFIASEQFWRVRLNFEEAIGLGWESCFRFRCRSYHWTLRAAYEMSQWLNQNELFYTFYFRGQDTISSVPIRSQGDLSFQGIQLSLSLDF